MSLSFIFNVLDLIWSKPQLYFVMVFDFTTEAAITEHIEDSELLCILYGDSVCGFDYGNIQNMRFTQRIAI